MTKPNFVHADKSIILSSHSVIALSRCSSLHRSILRHIVPDHRLVPQFDAINAAQRVVRRFRVSAHAKISDAKWKGIVHRSLAEERPDLARQWAPESNGSVTPNSVAAGSGFKAAWRCGEGCEHCGTPHEWSARVIDRTGLGNGCPLCCGFKPCRCRSVAAMHPELMEQWDWEGNQGTDPYSVACLSSIKVAWICTEHGQWGASPNSRVYSGSGCPECGKQRRSGPRLRRGFLKDELPDVYAELHPTKNNSLDIEELTCGSRKKVWWLCQSNDSRPEGCQHEHEWEAEVLDRCKLRKPAGCPFCTGHLVCPCKSLAELQPALLQYWDDAGNAVPLAEPLNPSRLGVSSRRKAWWRHECSDGQVCRWIAAINDVTRCFKATSRVPCPKCGIANRAATFAEHRRKLIMRG